MIPAPDLAASSPRPMAQIGGLMVETLNLRQTAQALVAYCGSAARAGASRPLYSTSVNGQVLSLCAADPSFAQLLREADSINPDGQPLVLMSKLLCRHPLPERVATTDLFPEIAALASSARLSFYLLGGAQEINARVSAVLRRDYPQLRLLGARHGYFSRQDEPQICAEIAALKPDFLWVGLGVPLEQEFCARNLQTLGGVGVVKTAGGLFDFIAGAKPRAPLWMQRLGLEWLFRLAQEPRRLFVRYALTNPHALLIMLRTMR